MVLIEEKEKISQEIIVGKEKIEEIKAEEETKKQKVVCCLLSFLCSDQKLVFVKKTSTSSVFKLN